MADINEFKEGTEILQNVDVSEIFTALALGIAKAQKKLDENSIEQAIKLSETKIANKSLLELGFAPTFYSFKEATISAYISLKMASKESLAINVSIAASYSSTNNLDSKQTDLVNDDKFAKGNEDYKSGKSISFKANETNKVKIEGKEIEFNPQAGDKDKECIKMIQGYEDELNKIPVISEVKTEICSGFTPGLISKSLIVNVIKAGSECKFACISLPYKSTLANYHVLKITEFDEKTVDLGSSKSFKISKTLVDTLTDLKTNLPDTNKAYAFSKEGKFYDCAADLTKPADLAVYFKYDSEKEQDKVKVGNRIYWDESLKAASETEDLKNNLSLIDVFKKMVHFIQRTGEKTISIAGDSDGSGSDNYNKKLAEKRANAFAEYLRNIGIDAGQIIETAGKAKAGLENKPDIKSRKAAISLNAHYIIIENTLATMTYPGENPAGNKFLTVKAVEAAVEQVKIKCTESGKETELTIPVKPTLEEVKTELANAENVKQYFFELGKDKNLYVLNKGALLKFYLFSKDSNNISIESVKSSSDSGEKKTESILIKDEFNKESKLKNDVSGKESNTFAISGSVDVRYSRQFETSMEGNAYMSAVMVSCPPPDEFKKHIIDNYLKELKNGGA